MDEPSKPSKCHGQYATDLLSNLSLAWIDDAAKGDSPFFLAINPVNPHNNLDWNGGDQKWTQPVPADRHKDDFPDAIVPRDTENFNPNRASGASWVKDLKQLDNDTLTDNDHYYRRRLQALQAVDDLVENTIKRLEHHKILDNTFIIYTSDNGFHISQHRLTPGKRCPYEEDVNVPMVIRGPKVPKGKTVDFVTSHLDIAPTVLNWAGAKGPGDFDGKIIPSDGNPGTKEPWEHVQIEHWGPVSSKDGVPDDLLKRGNTYKAARIIGPKYNLYYAVWCEGDHEIYDMTTDPSQMHNLHNTSKTLLEVPIEKLEHRLDAMLLVMKTCKGKTCRQPWEALHPDGKVQTLVEALDSKYDTFYKNQNKVNFEKCARGYHVQNELPIKYHTYGNGTDGDSQNSESMMYRDLEWWMNVG